MAVNRFSQINNNAIQRPDINQFIAPLYAAKERDDKASDQVIALSDRLGQSKASANQYTMGSIEGIENEISDMAGMLADKGATNEVMDRLKKSYVQYNQELPRINAKSAAINNAQSQLNLMEQNPDLIFDGEGWNSKEDRQQRMSEMFSNPESFDKDPTYLSGMPSVESRSRVITSGGKAGEMLKNFHAAGNSQEEFNKATQNDRFLELTKDTGINTPEQLKQVMEEIGNIDSQTPGKGAQTFLNNMSQMYGINMDNADIANAFTNSMYSSAMSADSNKLVKNDIWAFKEKERIKKANDATAEDITIPQGLIPKTTTTVTEDDADVMDNFKQMTPEAQTQVWEGLPGKGTEFDTKVNKVKQDVVSKITTIDSSTKNVMENRLINPKTAKTSAPMLNVADNIETLPISELYNYQQSLENVSTVEELIGITGLTVPEINAAIKYDNLTAAYEGDSSSARMSAIDSDKSDDKVVGFKALAKSMAKQIDPIFKATEDEIRNFTRPVAKGEVKAFDLDDDAKSSLLTVIQDTFDYTSKSVVKDNDTRQAFEKMYEDPSQYFVKVSTESSYNDPQIIIKEKNVRNPKTFRVPFGKNTEGYNPERMNSTLKEINKYNKNPEYSLGAGSRELYKDTPYIGKTPKKLPSGMSLNKDSQKNYVVDLGGDDNTDKFNQYLTRIIQSEVGTDKDDINKYLKTSGIKFNKKGKLVIPPDLFYQAYRLFTGEGQQQIKNWAEGSQTATLSPSNEYKMSTNILNQANQ